MNAVSFLPRLGLARTLVARYAECKDEGLVSEAKSLYQEVIFLHPTGHDAYIELGEILARVSTLDAVELYALFPFTGVLSFDDGYLHGEIVRHLMKASKFEDPRLKTSLIAMGKISGLTSIESYIKVLDEKFRYSKILKEIYAAVNGKDVDDPALQAFFKFKCW